MELNITKEWFERRAALEGDFEIGAGRRFPPAYGNCPCMCHRSSMLHFVACCHPSESDKEILRLCAEVERSKRPGGTGG